MTDQRNVVVSRSSSNVVSGVLGQASRATLLLRCSEGEFEIYVATPRVLEEGIRIRWDSEEPDATSGSLSTDLSSIFLSRPEELLATRMVRHRLLRIEFTPYDAAPSVATFPLVGLRQHTPALRGACPTVAAAFGDYWTITGVVRDSAGQVVPRAHVRVDDDSISAATRTDLRGRYRLRVPFRSFMLVGSSGTRLWGSQYVNLRYPEGAATSWDINLTPQPPPDSVRP